MCPPEHYVVSGAATDVHSYYGDPSVLDLTVIRKQAEERARGDHRGRTGATVIHYHKFGAPCERQHHEHFYPEGDERGSSSGALQGNDQT